MSGARRRWWIAYGVCAALAVAALALVTSVVLGLERAERTARSDADEQGRIGLALWQMDSWLAPLLAREAARPWFEYRAYYPSQRAYGKLLNRLDPSEVLTRSSLVTYESDWFRLHFQFDPENGLTSPQVPQGNERDHAEYAGLSGERIDANYGVLESLRGDFDAPKLDSMISCAVQAVNQEMDAPQTRAARVTESTDAQRAGDNFRELGRRLQSLQSAKQAPQRWNAAQNGGTPAEATEVDVGALVPLWFGQGGERTLCYVRRVVVDGRTLYQGFVADWQHLRDRLLAQSADLVPGATLTPVDDADVTRDPTGRVLATFPARLDVPPPSVAAAAWTSERTALLVTWLAVLGTLAAGALTLHKSIAFGEQRSRFASTVTHELRTPLTTFRMYSEMLAEDMVTDPGQRAEYLRTLQGESGRLSALVENVLAYARLEDGRAPARREQVSFAALVERATAAPRRRAQESGAAFDVHAIGDNDAALTIDVEAVAQIVFNLVDNACKYARGGGVAAIEVTAELTRSALRVRVRDHGPGVPARLRRAVFAPFERGDLGADGSISGVGLGLALSRGLARDLGGELTLETTADGASFLLELPRG